MKIRFDEDFKEQPANIKIIGVGGGGGNAINRMVQAKIKGVELISVNTDSQALRRSLANIKIQIGAKLTKGLGAGGNPEIGKQAAIESADIIKGELVGADMVFITAGMGGGTGTGAAPVVAEISRSLKALTVGVVTYPFELEGKVRTQQADNGIKDLRPLVDTLLIIPNDKLFEIGGKDMSWEEAFRLADDVLRQAIQSITDVITVTGEINVDFADIRQIITGAGEALMGIGESEGVDRTLKAVDMAIKSPLLESISISGAKGVLVNITSGKDFKIHELSDVLNTIRELVKSDAHVFYGQVIDPTMTGKVRITIIATGFQARQIRGMSIKEIKNKNISIHKEIEEDNILRPAYLRYKCRKLI